MPFQLVKNPDEDCEMVTALDSDTCESTLNYILKDDELFSTMFILSSRFQISVTKVQFQYLEAARTNRCDVLEMIIEQHACRLDVKNNLDRTALHLAAAQGCFEAVQMLVKARVPIDLPDKVTRALDKAISRPLLAMTTILNSSIDILMAIRNLSI